MILHYLKVSVRDLMRYKTQNLIALCGVALSLLCFSICLYCSRYLFGTDDCFQHKDRIVQLIVTDGKSPMSGTPPYLTEYLPAQGVRAAGFCAVAYPQERCYHVTINEEKVLPYDFTVLETDSAYRTVFTPRVLFGSWEQAVQTPNAVILSESKARQIFGSPEQAIGKPMVSAQRFWTSPKTTPREGGIAYTIQAVIEDLPLNTSLNFLGKTDALVMNDSEGLFQNRRENMTGGNTFVLPPEGQSAQQWSAELEKRGLTIRLFDHEEQIQGGYLGKMLWEHGPVPYFGTITLVAGVLVLLVGLLNFFHFVVGAFLTRIRECNIRRVNGAGFWNLFELLFTQMSVAILIAALFTCCLIELLAPYLHLTLVRYSIQIDPALLMWQTFTYLLMLLAVCAVISALVILKIRRIDIQSGLFGGTGRYGKHRLRNVLLGVQLFIGWIFLSLAAVLYLQSDHTGNNLFSSLSIEEKERILSVPLDYTFMKNPQKLDIIAEFRKCPDVEDILLADINYLQGISGTGLWKDENRDGNYIESYVMNVSLNFFQFMNLSILAGQTFDSMDKMVVDETLAKRTDEDLLGKTLYDYEAGYTVVGICAPFIANAYSVASNGYMFVPSEFSDYVGHCYVKCREGRVEEATAYVESVLRNALPENISNHIPTLMDDIREEQAVEFKLRGVVLFMAFISLLISMLGIYSAVTLDTEYRRKEMAIRKINGAGIRQIAILFARLYIVLLFSTAILAFPLVGVLLHFFSQMYASFVEVGVLFYSSIFLVVVLLTVVTVYVRIRNIARINPAEVIKRE